MTDYDPTRIDIRDDPLQQEMSGTAIHGNTPFVVKYVSHIEGNLWTGGCAEGLVLPLEIEHVVSLYPWEQYRLHKNVKTNLSIRMYDAEPQESEDIHRIADWANQCLDDGPTLIHCQAGLNRSGLIAALVLIKNGYEPEKAIALLREKRSEAVLCNKGFETWLLNMKDDNND